MVLSYRHAFHAGNHADVVKHSVLALLLAHLGRSPRPYFFLDTHTGAGLYHLRTDPFALKNAEYRTGVERVWTQRHTPVTFAPFEFALRKFNGFAPLSDRLLDMAGHSVKAAKGTAAAHYSLPPAPLSFPEATYDLSSLTVYPGSSALFAALRRPVDRMVGCELHSTESTVAKQFLHSIGSDKAFHASLYPYHPQCQSTAAQWRAKVMEGKSGFEAQYYVPPFENNGLIFIDPPYEIESEYQQVVSFMTQCHHRWLAGMQCLWYPLILGKESLSETMVGQLKSKFKSVDTIDVRLTLTNAAITGTGTDTTTTQNKSGGARVKNRSALYGCGMFLVNPPQLFNEQLDSSLLPFLATSLSDPSSGVIASFRLDHRQP